MRAGAEADFGGRPGPRFVGIGAAGLVGADLAGARVALAGAPPADRPRPNEPNDVVAAGVRVEVAGAINADALERDVLAGRLNELPANSLSSSIEALRSAEIRLDANVAASPSMVPFSLVMGKRSIVMRSQ